MHYDLRVRCLMVVVQLFLSLQFLLFELPFYKLHYLFQFLVLRLDPQLCMLPNRPDLTTSSIIQTPLADYTLVVLLMSIISSSWSSPDA